MIGRRTLLCALLLCAPALAGDETAPKLVLNTTQERYAFGEVPVFELGFQNRTSGPLHVVMPCDGSQHGLRTPSYAWTLERVDGEPVATELLGLCGTVNPLMPTDFQVVAPDTMLPIPVGECWLGPPGFPVTWLEPGRYRVRLTYSWDPSKVDPQRLQGEVGEKVQSTPKLELASAPVEFEIAPPSEAQAKLVAAWRQLVLVPQAPAEEPAKPASADEVRATLGDPIAEPHGQGQRWSYPLGKTLRLTVYLAEGTVTGGRVEYQR